MQAHADHLLPAWQSELQSRDGDEMRGRAATLSQQNITLVEGSSFCVSTANGDIEPHRSDGLFVRDTRVISRWQLLIDGSMLEALTVVPAEPFECIFMGRAVPRAGNPETTLIVERRRLVGHGMREDITLRNYGREAAGVDVTMAVDSDFADLFQVKEQRVHSLRPVTQVPGETELVLSQGEGADPRGVRVSAPAGQASLGVLSFRAVVPPQGMWSTSIEVLPRIQGVELSPSFPVGRPLEDTVPAQRMQDWRSTTSQVSVRNRSLANALSWSRRDLGALRISDPEHPDDDVVAAGAPWFMALFGRDAILTSWMMMPFAPELALGTLRTLARLQGREVDPLSEEQPGRILHEVRLGADPALALGGDRIYFGSIDSTPLFVMLVGHALRWGVDPRELAPLMPAVDAALSWIDDYGDRDGDGFVEYQRTTDRGLLHQGWKDSFDGISFTDGRAVETPVALAEVQGYVYGAYLAKASLDDALGGDGTAWRERAAVLKRRFHESFWMPERDFYAVALDGEKRQVNSVTSNIGQAMWTGIVDESVADAVVARLTSRSMFTGFGIRTLSSDSASFNPVSYHNGSIWPHDTVLCAAGIARYGFHAQATRVAGALLDAADAFGGRLPELFCGFDRHEKGVPVPYPTSCSPQAWAAAAPFEILRLSLGLYPDPAEGTFTATSAPALLEEVEVRDLVFGGHHFSVHATLAGASVEGLPASLRFEERPRGAAPDPTGS